MSMVIEGYDRDKLLAEIVHISALVRATAHAQARILAKLNGTTVKEEQAKIIRQAENVELPEINAHLTASARERAGKGKK